MAFTDWIPQVEGKYIDEDGVWGSQCADVVIHYVKWLWPNQPSRDTLGLGNAKDLWGNSSPAHFEKIPNSADPNQVPRAGDVMIWDATGSNPFGHIAIVLSATPQSIVLMEQDGFIDKDSNGDADGVAYRKTRAWTTNIIGWLRPKVAGDTMNTAERVKAVFKTYLQVEAKPNEVSYWTGRPVTELDDNAARSRFNYDASVIKSLQGQLKAVQLALANEQAKPPQEVIKEVVKIVEKPVEVKVYTHDEVTAQNVGKILVMVTAIFDYFKGQYKTFAKYIKK